MGRLARRVMLTGHGTVLASFESALYLESRAGVACLVPPTAPCGPLNLTLPGVESAPPALRDSSWRTDGTTLAIDGLGTFAISPCEEWTPPRIPQAAPAAIVAGVVRMRNAVAGRTLRGEVLVHTLESIPARAPVRVRGASDRSCPTSARFARTVPALLRWLDDALAGRSRPAPHAIDNLLGAGSGLTPSGDDCLVGVLVALRALGEQAVAEAIARIVALHAPLRTTRISAAHLGAACAGEAIEPVHAAIEAIASNSSPEPPLDALSRFGHGSGFDALAGVLLAASAIAKRLLGYDRSRQAPVQSR